MSREKELEWNLSSSRTQFIGELVSHVRIKFHQALKEPTKGNVRNYLNSLEALWFYIKIYVEDKDFIEDVDQKLSDSRDSLKGSEASSVLDSLRPVDQKINQKRVDLGLDISSKSRPEPGEELL